MTTPTIPAGNLFMNATTYAGTGAVQSITNGAAGASFQPDFIWFKSRAQAYSHTWYDSIRGTTKVLLSDSSSTESTSTSTQDLTAFNSNGFSLGTVNFNSPNNSASNPVAWQWKAGGTAVSNTSGTITSQVSANTTSGFSVVTYTGNGSSSATVGHGLGVAPSMIIVKSRSAASDWFIRHSSLAAGYQLRFTTGAQEQVSSATTSGGLGSGTSSVINFIAGSSNADNVNASAGTFVAYCWTPIAGYSAFGSYTGNGSADGPFVYLGFRPRFIMYKRTDSTGDWTILDTSRSTYNAEQLELYPDSSVAETAAGGDRLDGLSNGFKVRNSGSSINASGGTYIYAAFAENPLKFANAR